MQALARDLLEALNIEPSFGALNHLGVDLDHGPVIRSRASKQCMLGPGKPSSTEREHPPHAVAGPRRQLAIRLKDRIERAVICEHRLCPMEPQIRSRLVHPTQPQNAHKPAFHQHRVDERTGYIADLRRAQVHQIAREGRLGDVNPPLGQASAQSFLATDRLGRQKITDHLMTRTLGARKCGCCTHMHDYTQMRI